jgi:hypothetical protein
MIFMLEARDKALKDQLRATEQLLTRNGPQVDHTHADRLVKITPNLEQSSVLADSQRIQIVAMHPCPEWVKPGPPGVSVTRPLRGCKRNSKRHSAMS